VIRHKLNETSGTTGSAISDGSIDDQLLSDALLNSIRYRCNERNALIDQAMRLCVCGCGLCGVDAGRLEQRMHAAMQGRQDPVIFSIGRQALLAQRAKTTAQ
jgi:hypothetical protein